MLGELIIEENNCVWICLIEFSILVGKIFHISNSPESSDIGQNSDEDYLMANLSIASWEYLRTSGQSLIKENCHNSKTSDNIDMELGPVTKLNKKTKRTSKRNLKIMPCWQIVTSLYFFRFIANLEPSGSRIPDS